MKFVLYKKDNATEILPPLLLKPTYSICTVYAHVQCREPKKGQQKVQVLKKTTVLWPSRSY